MKIKEIRVLYPEKIRSMCIENNWYTRGTSEDYDNMFTTVYNSRKKVTNNLLYKIACDIFVHSEMDTNYSINDNLAGIMFALMEDCVKTCFDIID